MILFYIVFIIAGVLLEGTLGTLPLGLVGIILIGPLGNLGILAIVFLLGIFADIVLIRPLGLTAGIYLATIVLLRLYSRKIETERLRYLLPFTAIVVGLYSWYFYSEWLLQVVASVVIIGIVRITARALSGLRDLAGWKRREYGRLRL